MNIGIFIQMLESKEDQIIIGDPKIEITDVEKFKESLATVSELIPDSRDKISEN
jgi:hypothetical protein